MRAAFQGELGAYSEEAGYAYFGESVQMVPYENFNAVFGAVASGTCDCGLVPIENSLAGSIHQNYDLLQRHELHIVGEYFLRVRHCLIGFPGTALADIQCVISHPQALGQCEAYLRNLGVKIEPVYDTAGSVKMLKTSGEKATAAIASKKAAEIYNMHILQAGIEDNQQNYTRFLEISNQPVKPRGDAKTSIVFTLKNQPGALYKALKVFAARDIDLTKMESRPLIGKVWEYLFYIDLTGAISEEPVHSALDELRENSLMLRVLGSYPRFHDEFRKKH